MSLSDPDAHTRVPTFTAESPWPGPVLDSCCPALPLRKALKLVASLFAEAGAVPRKLLKLDPLVHADALKGCPCLLQSIWVHRVISSVVVEAWALLVRTWALEYRSRLIRSCQAFHGGIIC